MGPTGWLARLATAPLIGLLGLLAPPAFAQNQGLVFRDGTLGSLPAGPVLPGPDDLGQADYLIRADLGEQRGGNLFHSFSRFSIGAGERATFTDDGAPSPGGIEHVISRVTGGEPSQIDGTLRSTIEGADVWLFNPQGVGFGAGARIDVRGTFHAGSSDSVAFEDGSEPFRAEATPPAVLATAKPSAFGFLPDGSRAALVVAGGLDLTRGAVHLAAGDLTLTGAGLEAPGAELGFEASGTVRFADHTRVDVGGVVPGTISIRGGRIEVVEGSQLLAENESLDPSADPDAPGPGSIDVAAGESVLINDSLLSVNTWGAGNAGTIHLSGLEGHPGPDVTVENGPRIAKNFNFDPPHATVVGMSAETSGRGAAGTIDVHAQALTLSDGAWLSAASFGSDASGRAGAIRINADLGERPADSVDISRGAAIVAHAWGSPGNGGNVDVHVGSLVLSEGGYIRTSVSFGMPGSAGDVAVDADTVVIGSVDDRPARWEHRITGPQGPGERMGAGIFAAGLGMGTAGSVRVHASRSIILDDFGGDVFDLGRVVDLTAQFTGVITSTGQGIGGNVTLYAPAITVTRGATVASSTFGGSAAGDILLKGDRILIDGGGLVDSSTVLNLGPAGNVILDATESIEVVGHHEDFKYASVVSSGTLGLGSGGEVTLRAPLIVVDDGGVVSTVGVPVKLDHPLPAGGPAGNITLEGPDGTPAREILVRGGGRIEASSLAGPGRGGNILLQASDSIRVEGSGSGIASRTAGTERGSGGDIELRAPRISVANGGEISARSQAGFDELGGVVERLRNYLQPQPDGATAGGGAGSIVLHASKLVHLDGGEITTSVGSAAGGDITIDPVFVILQNGSTILATADAGGSGGEIRITTDNFFAFPGSEVRADSNIRELSGTVEIHSPDVNLAGTLAELPSTFLDAASQMRERCAARKSGERVGSFAVRGPGGIPAEPDGWLPAPTLPEVAAPAVVTATPPVLVAGLPAPLLLSGACP